MDLELAHEYTSIAVAQILVVDHFLPGRPRTPKSWYPITLGSYNLVERKSTRFLDRHFTITNRTREDYFDYAAKWRPPKEVNQTKLFPVFFSGGRINHINN